ncbi:MAG: SUF system NifU family Fe-S cluster assembly protein [Eubacteriales bacterium]|nr:SUF system NifU family Fe-S cluster assembly protein [Eubacteriales bacterium]
MTFYSELSETERSDLFKELLKDHYIYPRHHGLKSDAAYRLIHLKNPSCGDDLSVQIHMDGETISDICQEGEGCSICCASASMMAELCTGLSKPEALEKIVEFKKMVSGKDYDEEGLAEANALQGVVKLPPRIKCATLAWIALERLLNDEQLRSLHLETEDGEVFEAGKERGEK